MVGKEHGLCPLHMGVARHHHIPVFVCHANKDLLKSQEPVNDENGLLFQVHAHIKGHLVVTAPSRVEFPCNRTCLIPKGALHMHMDIFKGICEFKLVFCDLILHPSKALPQGNRLIFSDDPHMGKHGQMGNASLDVVFIELLINLYG